MPNFIDSDNLHINSLIATNIESHGNPIIGIETDFDGEIRNLDSTDIGADEFDGIILGVEEEGTIPIEYMLSQNYPNPFNSSSVIKYSIPKSSQVTLKIFNALGEELVTLVNEEKSANTYEVNWNAANLPSGVYFYQLRAGSFVETKKMILLK
jgi:hypothetical protein